MEIDKDLVKKLANTGWDINGDRLETSRSFTKAEAHHLGVEFQPISNRVGLRTDAFNENKKLSMDTKKAVRFFAEQDVNILLSDPSASLAHKPRRRG